MTNACRGSRDINLKIEWGYIPYNAFHLLALKTASVFIVITAFSFGVMGQLDFTSVILVVLFVLPYFWFAGADFRLCACAGGDR